MVRCRQGTRTRRRPSRLRLFGRERFVARLEEEASRSLVLPRASSPCWATRSARAAMRLPACPRPKDRSRPPVPRSPAPRRRHRYPVIIKAAAGGGGIGMIVHQADEFEGALTLPVPSKIRSVMNGSSLRSTSRARSTLNSKCWLTERGHSLQNASAPFNAATRSWSKRAVADR